jgi:hypothetical protein
MRLREWQQRLLLVVMSTGVVLVAAEIVARFLWAPGERQRVIRYDPELGWSLIPGSNLHSVDTDRGLDYHIRINSLGLRDPERSRRPPAGTTRVLMLGDSMVFGPGIEMGQRCSNRLDVAMGDRVEVLNAGVGGWGTDQEYLYLLRDGFELHPDAVILALCMVNDVVNNSLTHDFLGTARKPRFVLQDGQLQLQPVPPRTPPTTRQRFKEVLKYSRLFHYVGRHIRILQSELQATRAVNDTMPYYPEAIESDMSHWNVFHLPYSASFEHAFEVTEALIEAIDDSCKARNIPLLVFAFPQKAEVDAEAREKELKHHGYHDYNFDLDAPYDRLRRLCDRLEVRFVYPVERFRDENATRQLFFERDPHPNAAGNAMAAACLETPVEEMIGFHDKTHAIR